MSSVLFACRFVQGDEKKRKERENPNVTFRASASGDCGHLPDDDAGYRLVSGGIAAGGVLGQALLGHPSCGERHMVSQWVGRL